jgi:hypothetical protein
MLYRRIPQAVVILAVMSLWAGPGLADPGCLPVTQITDNEKDDTSPQICGSQIVWQGLDPNDSDWEIFLRRDTDNVQLTHNDTDDTNPQTSCSTVVWQGRDPNQGDWEIFYYDGNEITRLTHNDYDDVNPQVFNSYMVWEGWDGHDWEILFSAGQEIIALTENSHDDCCARISESLIVWQGGDGNDWEIFTAALPCSVTVKITPQSLNLSSKGRWITCHISFSELMDVNNVDTDSLRLEDVVAPHDVKVYANSRKIKANFDRNAVQQQLSSGKSVTVTLTGTLLDGTPFSGSDKIKVLDKGKKNNNQGKKPN